MTKNYLNEEQICCEEHYNCFIDEYKSIYKNKKTMKLDFNTKREKIFLLYGNILKYKKEKTKEDGIKNLIKILSLNISPCFIIKILNLIKNFFSDEKNKNNINVNDKNKNNGIKENNNIFKDEVFKLINNNEENKILLFNLLCHDFLDVKYNALSLILTINEYKPQEFKISFEFVKDNILPKNKLDFFNYKNYSPTSQDINILSKYCIDIINNLNTFKIYNNDYYISSSIFNFSYIYLIYIKFLNLFISYLNTHKENKYEILDILIHLNKNLNIEITLEFTNIINLYSISNNLLAKDISTFIPLLNYFMDAMIYYSNFQDNNIFLTLYNFIINMISIIKESKKKLIIIDYIIKYYSLLKNRVNDLKNNNILFNNSINNTLNKLLIKISINYMNNETLNDNYKFLIILIFILFNYIIIYNQDKSLYSSFIKKKYEYGISLI